MGFVLMKGCRDPVAGTAKANAALQAMDASGVLCSAHLQTLPICLHAGQHRVP